MNNTEMFIQALESRNMELLKRVPKTDLHNHSTSGCSREYIRKHAGINIPIMNIAKYTLDL